MRDQMKNFVSFRANQAQYGRGGDTNVINHLIKQVCTLRSSAVILKALLLTRLVLSMIFTIKRKHYLKSIDQVIFLWRRVVFCEVKI
jgi:hypothetical protein